MMKFLALGATLLGMVSANELPQFSATDDYDELNLNIRLLQGKNDTNSSMMNKTMDSDKAVPVYTVEVVVAFTFNTPYDTLDALMGDATAYAAVQDTMITGMATSAGVDKTLVTIKSITTASRRELSKGRKLAALNLVATFAITTTEESVANSVKAAVESETFGAAFEAATIAAIAADTTLSADPAYSVEAGSASATATVTKTEPAGSTAAASEESGSTQAAAASSPSPAPAPASNAMSMKANVVMVSVAALASFVF